MDSENSAPNTVPTPWVSPYAQGIIGLYQGPHRFAKRDGPRLSSGILGYITPSAASSLERITRLTSQLETEVRVLHRETELSLAGHAQLVGAQSPLELPMPPNADNGNLARMNTPTNVNSSTSSAPEQWIQGVQSSGTERHRMRITPPPLYQE